ncbi:MAG: TonB-dependent receptor [Candidatus Kapabacteria bacterium]|nr:TonB-dependent receptor [Candidatus Kapabacteria bacterium]
MPFKNTLLAAALLLIIFSLPSAMKAESQESATITKTYTLPSITVQTTRAQERKSPVAFSEINSSSIKSTYTYEDLPQFLSTMPSVSVYSQSGNGVGYTNLTMRGFDQRRIAVLVNGVPQNDPEDHNVYWIDMPDLAESADNIQMQRGAGLMNYGAAAIGGSISLTTSNYLNKRFVRIGTGISYQQMSGVFSNILSPSINKELIEFSSGLLDTKYAFYGRLSRINSEGYRDHSWANLNSYFFSIARFDENLSTQINIFGGPLTDGLVYNGLPKQWITDPKLRRSNLSSFAYDSNGTSINLTTIGKRRDQENEEFSQPHYELLNEYKIADNISFKSTLFYYTGTGYFDYDGSWANDTTLRLTSQYGFHPNGAPTNTLLRGLVNNHQGGFLPKIIINLTNSDLIIGGEIRYHRSEHWGKVQSAGNLPADYDPAYKIYYYEGDRDIYSAFVRMNYELNKDITLFGDVQLVSSKYRIKHERAGNINVEYKNMENKSVGINSQLFDLNYLFPNERIGLNWILDKHLNAFAMLANTWREPRMGNLYAADGAFSGTTPQFENRIMNDTTMYDFSKPLIKPENMIDIEAGTKYIDEKLAFSANIYYMIFSNELVKSGRLDYFGNPIEVNAEKTVHTGIELEGKFTLLQDKNSTLNLMANITYSSNKIKKFDNKFDDGSIISFAENPVPGFPDILANLIINYNYNDASISLIGKYSGEFRTDNFGDLLTSNAALKSFLQSGWSNRYYTDNKVDPYFILNANLSYTLRHLINDENIRFNIVVNNILNKLYAAGAEGKEFFPGAERNVYFGVNFEF